MLKCVVSCCAGNTKSEKVPKRSGSHPQQQGGSSEQSCGRDGEGEDSAQQDTADEQGG